MKRSQLVTIFGTALIGNDVSCSFRSTVESFEPNAITRATPCDQIPFCPDSDDLFRFELRPPSLHQKDLTSLLSRIEVTEFSWDEFPCDDIVWQQIWERKTSEVAFLAVRIKHDDLIALYPCRKTRGGFFETLRNDRRIIILRVKTKSKR